MRRMLIGVALGALVAGGAVITAEPKAFSGIKLVDLKARTPERSVNVVFGDHALQLLEPGTTTVLKAFPYKDLVVTHSISAGPPPSAGDPSAAATQRASFPMYHGKIERNWLTLEAPGSQATLRVSAKVYDEVRAALQQHQVIVHTK
jgi:hypothetical protein